MYEIDLTYKNPMQYTVTDGNNQIEIDANKEKEAGTGAGPLPMLLMALAGCVGVYTDLYFNRKNIPVKGLKIKVKSELTPSRPHYLKDIIVDLDLGETELPAEEKEKFLNFLKLCPAHNTLENRSEIEIRI